jgi:hypothetical protein
MNPHEMDDLGSQLGNAAVEHIAQRAEDYSERERQRIELLNEARINALRIEGAHLTWCAHRLEKRLQDAELAGNARRDRRKEWYYWTVAGILSLAAFFFSIIALQPYRLGWTGYLYCLGIALATPFGVEEFLQAWRDERVLKAVVTVVFLAALIGGSLLAAVRGELLAASVVPQGPAAVIEGDSATPPAQDNTFYTSTHGLLRLLMLFLALAIDLGAGVAVHRALMIGAAAGESAEALAEELAGVRMQLAGVVSEITALRNASAIFLAGFWRDFYRAILTQATRKAVTKWASISLCLLAFAAVHLSAQTRTNLVIAIDLSTSEAVKGQDGVTQLQENIKGVDRLLGSIEAGSRIAVIGITQDSFSSPYIVLKAETSADPGYFGERLASAQRQIRRAWRGRAEHLTATAPGTDLLGAIRFANELFGAGPPDSRKILVLCSDMRHVTRGLNLETPRMVAAATMLTVQQKNLVANLAGVTVYVVGANADERRVGEWESLKAFWMAYFQKAGATLGGYSMLCDPPKLAH